MPQNNNSSFPSVLTGRVQSASIHIPGILVTIGSRVLAGGSLNQLTWHLNISFMSGSQNKNHDCFLVGFFFLFLDQITLSSDCPSLGLDVARCLFGASWASAPHSGTSLSARWFLVHCAEWQRWLVMNVQNIWPAGIGKLYPGRSLDFVIN